MNQELTTNPFNLSTTDISVLSFKHQISMIDDRTVNSPGNETPDRALVMVKKVNNSGVEQGVWIKIEPYQNVYHIQGTDNFTECVFGLNCASQASFGQLGTGIGCILWFTSP